MHSIKAFEKDINQIKENFKESKLLLDIVMEDISGLDVCKEIRNNPKTAHIPVIFLTATHESLIEKGYEVGGDEFLSKPVKPQLLKEKVKQLLQRPVIKNISYN